MRELFWLESTLIILHTIITTSISYSMLPYYITVRNRWRLLRLRIVLRPPARTKKSSYLLSWLLLFQHPLIDYPCRSAFISLGNIEYLSQPDYVRVLARKRSGIVLLLYRTCITYIGIACLKENLRCKTLVCQPCITNVRVIMVINIQRRLLWLPLFHLYSFIIFFPRKLV